MPAHHARQEDRPTPTDLARDQQGIILRTELLAAGVPDRTVSNRCRSGRWQTPLPGVVALHSGALSWDQRYRAALLYAGPRRTAHGTGSRTGPPARSASPTGPGRRRAPGARDGPLLTAPLLTGPAALALYRLKAAPAPEDVREIDVLTPTSSHLASRQWVRVHRTRRMPRPVLMQGRLPVAPLLRAAVDTARLTGPGDRTRTLLHEIVQARGIAPAALAAELRAARLPRRPDLAAVLEELSAGTRSPAEALARTTIRRTDLPQPLWNPTLHLDGDLLAVPDAYWPEHGVLLEVDSRAHHWAVADWERTMARHNRLAALGFRVLHVSPSQLRRTPDEVLTALRTALTTGPHGPLHRISVVPA
ncbi:hypothetical protein LHJ74_13290 [Streptomyces sp. N2-109]|uniref:AbiEi antitoxin N-terminal domain-containing protein n=1 Tax=Streptomyces gossypii TaxID=2883101 RepID=A0ABT2JSM2_9ACTN|nr:type IV toxin-antitoxin system AbiEi family antitoxin domain-containing protein [Streptomyces gossypii]MCT2590872.1 hypothetical protein [Streptomyces gossypii]